MSTIFKKLGGSSKDAGDGGGGFTIKVLIPEEFKPNPAVQFKDSMASLEGPDKNQMKFKNVAFTAGDIPEASRCSCLQSGNNKCDDRLGHYLKETGGLGASVNCLQEDCPGHRWAQEIKGWRCFYKKGKDKGNYLCVEPNNPACPNKYLFDPDSCRCTAWKETGVCIHNKEGRKEQREKEHAEREFAIHFQQST